MAHLTENPFDNPHHWLKAYGMHGHYFNWAFSHGAFEDLKPEQPHVADVQDKSTLHLLPRRVILRRGLALR